MDFLTAFPYIGILVAIALNAYLVIRRDIHIDQEDDPNSP